MLQHGFTPHQRNAPQVAAGYRKQIEGQEAGLGAMEEQVIESCASR
jgi:hypothetical protein